MRLLLSLILVLIIGSTNAQEEVLLQVPDRPQWEEFKSYKGNFRVIVPGSMTEKVDSIETDIGKVAYHTFFYQPEDQTSDNLFYQLSYCDYPANTIHSDSLDILDEFFETTMDAATFSISGELLYSGENNFRNYPGRYWRIDYLDGKAVIKTHAFLVENRFYSLQTISIKEKTLNTSSDKFMESFQLLE